MQLTGPVKFIHRALHAVHAAAVGALVAMVAFVLLIAYVVSPAWIVPAEAAGTGYFTTASGWNMELPRYPALSSYAGELGESVAALASNYGAELDSVKNAAPVYQVDMTTPLVTVSYYDCDGVDRADLAAQWQAVPIPFYAQPSANGRMVVYQSATQTMWEFGGVNKQGDTWSACRGGKMQNVATSNGAWASPYGVTVSGLALLGGQITASEYKALRIDHAIGLSLPRLGGTSGWPATQSLSGSGSAYPGLGARLQLDPQLDINSLGLSPIGRAIAQAAQKYGFIVWDTSSTVAVSMENPLSYTTRGAPSPYGGQLADSLSGFPWQSLRALPRDYGKIGHLPVIHTFSASNYEVVMGQQVELQWRADNVTSCSVPGVMSGGSSSGKATAPSTTAASAYTLVCAGPSGSASRSLSIQVRGGPADLPYVPDEALTITTNLSGGFSAVDSIYPPEQFAQIYKVMYYDGENWLQTTTQPTFMLDTTQLPDGEQTVRARIFFRDGSQETKLLNVRVDNQSEALVLAHPLSYETVSTPVTPFLVTGFLVSLGVACLSGWMGWRRAYV